MEDGTAVAIVVGVGLLIIGGILVYKFKTKKVKVKDADFGDIDLEGVGARIILAQMDEKEMGHA